jgi:hypothetical protein
MKRRSIAFTVSVALVASVGLTSTAMPAEQFQGRPMAGGHATASPPIVSPPILPHGFFGHPKFPRHFVAAPPPHPFFPHRVEPHRVGPHRFIPSVVIGGPAIAYASTTVYPPPIVYAAPVLPYAAGGYADNGSGNYTSPAVYEPPAGGTATVAAAPAPMPNVIQYGTGRYELRGDGLAIPYTWVWIPNPPPAPPSAAPTGALAPGDSPSSHGQIFRWTDTQGVLHMTDRWESVPPQYRPQAKQNLPS